MVWLLIAIIRVVLLAGPVLLLLVAAIDAARSSGPRCRGRVTAFGPTPSSRTVAASEIATVGSATFAGKGKMWYLRAQ